MVVERDRRERDLEWKAHWRYLRGRIWRTQALVKRGRTWKTIRENSIVRLNEVMTAENDDEKF
jgi:hypothetical protein